MADGAHEFGMSGVKIFLGMPTHRPLSPYTVRSLMETQNALWNQGISANYEIQYGSSLVHNARTKTANAFLQSDCSHLFWVDSDMVWQATDFLRLCALGTKMACVGATYTAKKDPPQFMLFTDSPGTPVEANEYGCLPIGGLGLGFTIVQRQIMERLAAKAPLCRYRDIGPDPVPEIFRCDKLRGPDGIYDARGEDMAFFADVRELGETVWIDPTITLGHEGSKVYSASLLDHITKEQEHGTSCQPAV